MDTSEWPRGYGTVATSTGQQGPRLAAIVGSVSTGHEVLPPDQYVASLARKRIASTAFFRDTEGRVLVVNPVYKPAWDLPGGAAEADESPRAACRREVAEELGLDRPPGRLLAVDWVPARTIGPNQTLLPDGVIIVYDGGVLTPAEVKEIVLADGELARYEFITADEAAGRVTPLVARRIAACLQACEAGTVAALENGSPVALRRLLLSRRQARDRPEPGEAELAGGLASFTGSGVVMIDDAELLHDCGAAGELSRLVARGATPGAPLSSAGAPRAWAWDSAAGRSRPSALRDCLTAPSTTPRGRPDRSAALARRSRAAAAPRPLPPAYRRRQAHHRQRPRRIKEDDVPDPARPATVAV